MRILLSNDDGITAPGIAAMRQALVKLGHVDVVAPNSPQSAAAHGITVHGPVAVRKVHVQDEFFGFSVEGRPADCVKLAIRELLIEPPDLVVSGINDGANVSINVLYSGTVAAAAEGALLGFPAIAVSMKQGEERDFNRAARLAMPIIHRLLEIGLAPGELININIPDLTPGDPLGICVVPMATRIMEDRFARHTAPDGRDYFWLVGDTFAESKVSVHSDLDAIEERYISITPLQFDMTQYAQLDQLRKHEWHLDSRASR